MAESDRFDGQVSPEDLVALVGVDIAAEDLERIEFEERLASQRRATIEAGRRKAGLFGAAAAGVMLGLRDVFEGPPKDDTIVAVAESPGDPGDIDTDGIAVTVGDVDVWAPPPASREQPTDDQASG